MADPQVVDLNNDGKKDIVAGSYFGAVHWFSGTDSDEYHAEGEIIANGSIYNCEKFSHPALGDLNNDGLLDLLVTGEKMWYQNGNKSNYALFYNTGTMEQYQFGNPMIFKEDGGLSLYNHRSSAVQFIDINKDSLLDLVATDNLTGQIKYYENNGTKEAPVFNDPFILTSGEGSKTWLPYMGNSDPDVKHEVCDWNNDGAWDIIFGGSNKVKRLYISYGIPVGVNITKKSSVPASEVFEINHSTSTSTNGVTIRSKTDDDISISLYTISGKSVIHGVLLSPSKELTLYAMSPGVYLLKALSGKKNMNMKLTIK